MTSFRCQIPVQTDPTKISAVNTFLDSIGAIASFTSNMQYVYTSHDTSSGTYIQQIEGIFPPSNNSTALGYLNTLNAALGANINCSVVTVTSEP